MSDAEPGTPDAAPSGPADPAPSVAAGPAASVEPSVGAAPAASATPSVGAAPAASVSTRIEPPSPDVDVTAAETALPGAHRGGFTRPPTAPVAVSDAHLLEVAAGEHGSFEPHGTPVAAPPPTNFAVLALGFAIVGLIASFVVGWAFPLGVVALVFGARSVRRGRESRQIAVWAIVLAALSLVYSAGWLAWAGVQSGVLSALFG